MPLPTHSQMVNAILGHYERATPGQRDDGRQWYPAAQAAALALAAGTDFSRTQCAGVIAALSPRISWSQNLRAAGLMVDAASWDWADAPVVAGLPNNRAKAWRILKGERPDRVLGGDKVTSFFANIMGDTDAVTIDVWACRVAGLETTSVTAKQYAAVRAAYTDAARLAGETPRNMQAITWIAARGAAA